MELTKYAQNSFKENLIKASFFETSAKYNINIVESIEQLVINTRICETSLITIDDIDNDNKKSKMCIML